MSETRGGPGEAALHVRVEGRVQGVGFRRFVERVARELGLRGWARNLTDGSVEVRAQGAEAAIATLRRRLAEGPPYAAVARLVDLGAGRDAAAVPEAAFRLLRDADPDAPPAP